MKATTLALISLYAAANAESHGVAPIPRGFDAPDFSRLDINSGKIRDAIADAIADLRDARDLSALLDFELNFDFSPSEFLADKAREALDNFEEPPPKNWRERLQRAARDAAIESAISALELAGKTQEDIVKDFLKDSAEEVKEFATVEIEEWKQFIEDNVEELEDFKDSPAVQALLEDPLSVVTEEYWEEHGDALREILEDIEDAEEFVLGQIEDAKEFLKMMAEDTREMVEGSFGFVTDTVETILRFADRFGIQHNALDALEEFVEDPLEFIKKAVLKIVKEKASDRENTLLRADRSSCWKRGEICYFLMCEACCDGYGFPSLLGSGLLMVGHYGVCN